MENYYYTPEIDEFCVGFQYEIELKNPNWNKLAKPKEDVYEFVSKTFDTSQSFSNIISKINNRKVRVKYLDKQDIESLGWKFSKKGDKYSFNTEYYILVVEDWINTGTLWELVFPDPEKHPSVFELRWETYGSYDTENGKLSLVLRNKSELGKLMEQLRIHKLLGNE